MNAHLPKPRTRVLKVAARWFARVRSGDVSAAECTRFEAWLKEKPEHSAAFAAMEESWVEAGMIEPMSPRSRSRAAERRFLFRPAFRLAALTVLAVLGVFFFRAEMERAWTAIIGEEMRYATKTGETRTITLRDGSVLEMNVNTSFTARFSWWKRCVDLAEGEIFLRVRRDFGRPFEVTAQHGLARVLGTSFHVRSRDGQVSVDVEEGSVRVEAPLRGHSQTPLRSVVLRKGEGVDYGRSGGISKARKARLDEAADWREGKIAFRSMRLAEVLEKLEHYHGVRLRLAQSALGEERFTGVFGANDLDGILEAVALSFSLTVRTEEDGTRVFEAKGR